MPDCSNGTNMAKTAFGTTDIARMCHVAPTTVGRWLAEGKIPFFTTAGRHRRVCAPDLIVFLKEHGLPVPPEVPGVDIKEDGCHEQ